MRGRLLLGSPLQQVPSLQKRNEIGHLLWRDVLFQALGHQRDLRGPDLSDAGSQDRLLLTWPASQRQTPRTFRCQNTTGDPTVVGGDDVVLIQAEDLGAGVQNGLEELLSSVALDTHSKVWTQRSLFA